ncbi:hypothetical protein [Arthrobacter sp. A2-55]|uniref:hypothetical protein n=1 Tax=Arthrobacter sp. A2-55 TaxID=2897337 RepID=UPI0021CDDF54|nr:hypothetical protein [Arthrobacter sp. A2-55]MCU6481963.1 hypothetical protein [Arthrobacter sp. A2-55]
MTNTFEENKLAIVQRFSDAVVAARAAGHESFTIRAWNPLWLNAGGGTQPDLGFFSAEDVLLIAAHYGVDGLNVKEGASAEREDAEARYSFRINDGCLSVKVSIKDVDDWVSAKAKQLPSKQPKTVQIILELIETARAAKFGTLVLSRHMGKDDVESHEARGVIFRQFLASDLQIWSDYFDSKRSTPQLAGVRSELDEDVNGPRVLIRLSPRDPSLTENAAAPVGNEVSTSLNNHADLRALGLGDPDYCALLPKQRSTVDAQGLVLFLPYTGITVVPYQMGHDGGWYAVVTEDSEHYQRGGYPLWIPRSQIETGIERRLAPVDRTILEGN